MPSKVRIGRPTATRVDQLGRLLHGRKGLFDAHGACRLSQPRDQAGSGQTQGVLALGGGFLWRLRNVFFTSPPPSLGLDLGGAAEGVVV